MVLVDTVFYAALTPLVPYFTEELRLSKSLVGVLSGAFGAGVLLGSAPGGYLATRLGVRPTAVAGLCLMSVASLLFGLASGAWELVALRLAAGFGSALSWVSALTWLTAQTPEERRGQMLGTLGSAAVVGALLGPALGSVAATVGVSLTFALVCGVGLAVALWARFSPLLFGVLTVLAPLTLSGFGWGAAAIGAVFLIAALFEAAVHPLLGRWSDRAGYRPPVVAGLLASLAVLISLPLAPAAPLVALLVVLAGGAFNAPLIPGTALLSRSAESAGIAGALAFGAANFAWASGYAIGASLGGTLADLGGDVLSYLSLAAACLLALLLLRRTSLVT